MVLLTTSLPGAFPPPGHLVSQSQPQSGEWSTHLEPSLVCSLLAPPLYLECRVEGPLGIGVKYLVSSPTSTKMRRVARVRRRGVLVSSLTTGREEEEDGEGEGEWEGEVGEEGPTQDLPSSSICSCRGHAQEVLGLGGR